MRQSVAAAGCLEDCLDLGSGRWDRDGRRSYLRLDRVFELDEDDIRREGSVLEPERFSLVVDALRRLGWRCGSRRDRARPAWSRPP